MKNSTAPKMRSIPIRRNYASRVCLIARDFSRNDLRVFRTGTDVVTERQHGIAGRVTVSSSSPNYDRLVNEHCLHSDRIRMKNFFLPISTNRCGLTSSLLFNKRTVIIQPMNNRNRSPLRPLMKTRMTMIRSFVSPTITMISTGDYTSQVMLVR